MLKQNVYYLFIKLHKTNTLDNIDIMFTAPLVDIVNGTSFIAMRSIISKLVPPDELGMQWLF